MKKQDGERCLSAHDAIQDTLYVVGGKWKLVILSVLMNDGKHRFGELARKTGISPRILSKELQEMEMNKLVSRKVCNTRPVTVEYAATSYACTLKEVLDAMIGWGQAHRRKIRNR